MKIAQICRILEDFAPLVWQENYDNCGLLVGDENAEISSALLTVDVTEEVVDEAISLGAKLIIAHHPLIFKSLKKLTSKTETERVLLKLVKNDIAVYAAHTNFDNAPGGVSHALARKIGLKNCRILALKFCGKTQIGCGVVGVLDEEIEEEKFFLKLKQTLDIQTIRHSPFLNKKIKTVALCGGSGAEFIENAKKENADVFLTADLKYHDYFLAEKSLVLADVGHFESEQFIKEIFFEQIKKNLPTFALNFSQTKTNKINYI